MRRAPVVPTPAGRAERDAFDAWHSERLRHLHSVEERLCFGRLDLTGGGRRYVGRIGLSDDTGHQLLVDWRAPAAAAFYQATALARDGVIRRRHLATRGRTVVGVDDEVLDPEAMAGTDLVVTGDGALLTGVIRAVTEHRTGRMRDIVSTLQAEQDAVVRAPLPGVLVVQGGPGTGKTAVALHRAAYLLYTHRDRIARSGVLVVGPTRTFLGYIEQVLPSLGESGVVLATPGRLFPGVDATAIDPDDVALVKGDLRMARVIRAAVRARQRLIEAPIPIPLDDASPTPRPGRPAAGEHVVLRARVVAEARARARQGGRPHNEARLAFVRHVLEDLARQLAAARGLAIDTGVAEDRDEWDALLAELRDCRHVRREVNLRWLPLDARTFVAGLLARPQRLAEAADGILTESEQRLLHRAADAPWTVADVPLLDEAAELIGPDVSSAAADGARRAQAARERAEALEYARGVLAMSGDAAAMLTPQMLADRFEGAGPAIAVAERAAGDRTWTYGHAVVDEAQELSPMQWRLLARRVPSRSMTVVGDLAQTGAAAGATSWTASLDPIAAGRWHLAELTVNYRTPEAIMALAGRVLAAAGVTASAPRSARHGAWPPAVERLPEHDSAAVAAAVAEAIHADEEALGGGRHAVLGPVSKVAALAAVVPDLLPGPLAERVDLMTVREAKGLEFDAVTVVDPAGIVAASSRGAGDLYVALTRCTQRLTVFHHGDLPPGLAEPGRTAADAGRVA